MHESSISTVECSKAGLWKSNTWSSEDVSGPFGSVAQACSLRYSQILLQGAESLESTPRR